MRVVLCSERKERERRFCDDVNDVNDDVFEKCFFFLLFFSLFSLSSFSSLFFSFFLFLKIFQRLFLLVKERERVSSLRVFCDTRLKIIMSYSFA